MLKRLTYLVLFCNIPYINNSRNSYIGHMIFKKCSRGKLMGPAFSCINTHIACHTAAVQRRPAERGHQLQLQHGAIGGGAVGGAGAAARAAGPCRPRRSWQRWAARRHRRAHRAA
eukprot:SAG11_NODE_16683_length_540_cov_1.811791_1_plen_114_part_01